MSQPTREEVKAFIDALRYGMKVSHKPEFFIALAEGWLEKESKPNSTGGAVFCDHKWKDVAMSRNSLTQKCIKCGCYIERV